MGYKLHQEIFAENTRILNAQKYPRATGNYSTDRNWLAFLYSEIYPRLPRNPSILEIGCGDGNSLLKIQKDYDVSRLYGTSLQTLPAHESLQGITIYTGIMAEELPDEWEETFDVVMACAVLMWTDIAYSIPNLFKVIKNDGWILVLDRRDIICSLESKASQLGYEIHQPRYSNIKNLFGSIIHKQS